MLSKVAKMLELAGTQPDMVHSSFFLFFIWYMIRYCMMWNGRVWYGMMVWYGMVWEGTGWDGMGWDGMGRCSRKGGALPAREKEGEQHQQQALTRHPLHCGKKHSTLNS